jgi:hypothetical protein
LFASMWNCLMTLLSLTAIRKNSCSAKCKQQSCVPGLGVSHREWAAVLPYYRWFGSCERGYLAAIYALVLYQGDTCVLHAAGRMICTWPLAFEIG